MAFDPRDPYAILGVPCDADRATIAAVYRRLARQHHPDAGGAADRAMADVNWAWSILSDAERRHAWDARVPPAGTAGHWAPRPPAPASWEPPATDWATGGERWGGGGGMAVARAGGIGCLPLAAAAVVLSTLVLFGGLASDRTHTEPGRTVAPAVESAAPR